MPTPTVFEGINPRGTQTLIPCRDTTAFPRSEQAVLGAKNFLPNNNTTQTINGIPFTKNADGSVTIGAGTASANTSYILGDIKPKAGNYILSRGTTNGQAFLSVSKYNGNTWVAGLVEIGNQAISEKEFTVDYNGYDTLRGFIYIGSGITISTPFTVYPMVRLATDPDPTYAPPAMTNRELTEKVTINSSQITLSSNVTANNNRVNKQGNVVDLYLYITSMPDTASGDVIIGITPFKPIDDYLFFTVYSTDAPFQPIAGGFIRSNNGEIVIKSGAMNTKTSCYIQCTYICQ